MAKKIQSIGNIDNSMLIDPVAGQQQAKYYKDGLDYLSNDENIIPRDEVGNIILNEGFDNNTKLVIATVTEQISTKSVLRVLDTRFQYFKFPVQIAQGNTININTEFNIDIDTITTELKLPITVDDANQPIDLIKINTTYDSTWFYGEDSNINSIGFKQLPFAGNLQSVPNSYVLTKDIINILIRQNQTLKFTIQTQYLTRDSNRTGINLRLNRVNAKTVRQFNPVIIYSEANTSGDPGDGTNPNGFAASAYPIIFMEYFVDPTDLADGDTYFLEAAAGNPTWILAANTYWLIEPTAIPTNASLYGASPTNVQQNAGIYNLYADNVLYTNEYSLIAKQTLGSNYALVLEDGTTIANNEPVVSAAAVAASINMFEPFGIAGEYDGQEKYLNTGGITVRYTWNATQQNWVS